jgi:hypothetical protein
MVNENETRNETLDITSSVLWKQPEILLLFGGIERVKE